MPPKASALLATLSTPSRLPYTSIRLFSTTLTHQIAPPTPPPRSWAGMVESSRRVFQDEEFESRLKALKEQHPVLDVPGDIQQSQKPGSTGAGGEEDKRVELAELVQTQHRFGQGDVYAPHDLSFQEQRKRRARKTPAFDAMDLLGINPIKEYRNFSMMSEYMTELGRIKHSRDTGLRPVNQRRMAKAIRRAVGLGLMPAVHRHPEVMGMAKPDRKYIAKTW